MTHRKTSETPTPLPLPDQSVFKKVEVHLHIQNRTTDTFFRESPASSISEFLSAGWAIEVPNKCCALGHHLLIQLEVNSPAEKETFKFEVTAQVDEVKELEDGTDRIRVSLVQYEKRELERFKNFFDARQKEIIEFLAAARGYD